MLQDIDEFWYYNLNGNLFRRCMLIVLKSELHKVWQRLCAVASLNILNVFCNSSWCSSVAATWTLFSVLFRVILCATKSLGARWHECWQMWINLITDESLHDVRQKAQESSNIPDVHVKVGNFQVRRSTLYRKAVSKSCSEHWQLVAPE